MDTSERLGCSVSGDVGSEQRTLGGDAVNCFDVLLQARAAAAYNDHGQERDERRTAQRAESTSASSG